MDFSSADGDKLVLDARFFQGLAAGQTVLVVNGTDTAPPVAATSAPTVLYNSTSGVLSFDADGNGSNPAIAFAMFDATQRPTTLTATNFDVII